MDKAQLETASLPKSIDCALSGEQPDAFPGTVATHGEYAASQRRKSANAGVAGDLPFWEEKPPLDRVRRAVMSLKASRLRLKLNAALAERLRETSQQENVGLFTIFAAALNTLLYRYTGRDEILLGIPTADRDRQDLQSAIGFLLHTHVLPEKLSGSMTFRELLGSLQKGTLELDAPRCATFDGIVHELGQERDSGHTPSFQVMLNWRDRDRRLSFISMEELAVESLLSVGETSKFDLLLFVTDNDGEIWLEMEPAAGLFDKDRVERMLGHYQTLLDSATADPVMPLDALNLLPDWERRRVLVDWNATAAEYRSNKCVHQLIEEQAARTPGAVALVFEDASLSYAELNSRANQLAHYLRALGVRPDTRVAICVDRSFEMVVALLAVLKAGGAYLPLDPTYPAERLRFMVQDSASVAVLVQPHLKNLFAGLGDQRPLIDLENTSPWSQLPVTDPDPGAIGLTPQHLAYVIYTSGSTGQPKGVMLHHQGLCNRLDWMQSAHPMHPSDAILQKTSFGFDVSLEEIFPPLLAGARLVIARPEAHKDPAYLVDIIRRRRITIIHFVPSMLHAFLQYSGAALCTGLVRVFCSGETLPASLAQRFQTLFPNIELFNMYGPTETTVEMTAWKFPRENLPSNIPIGSPIANTRVYILDALQQPVPIGVPGEIYVAGVQVARGYLNRPELTAEKFLADPFDRQPGARMYRSGDLGRWRADGNIEFLGRNDFQVKIRGFRVELGEIENELARCEGIGQCVVATVGNDPDEPADKRLVAFLVPAAPNSIPSVESLRETLQHRLPGYMVPASFAIVNEIPLTPNGKADIGKLMNSGLKAAQRETPVDAPRDSVEARLVQIWERVLDVRPIGIRNNFFDVGGYSLMIMKLFAQINKSFHRSLPIATIFRFPTIEQLAALIRGKTIDTTELVPIRTQGTRKPIFIVHSYLAYDRFRQVIDKDRPLYGLHEREDDDERISSVYDRVAEYARLIREAQPEGPYHLLAWCAAGAMTVELARSLEKSGGQVALVGLIDAVNPSYMVEMRRQRAKERRITRLQEWVRYHMRRREQFSELSAVRYFERALRSIFITRSRRLLLRYGKPLFRACGGLGTSIQRYLDHVASVRIENLEPYRGRITLFRPLETNLTYRDPTLGWREVATGGVDLVWTPGDHETMFKEGNVEKFGQLLKEVLDGEVPMENRLLSCRAVNSIRPIMTPQRPARCEIQGSQAEV